MNVRSVALAQETFFTLNNFQLYTSGTASFLRNVQCILIKKTIVGHPYLADALQAGKNKIGDGNFHETVQVNEWMTINRQ